MPKPQIYPLLVNGEEKFIRIPFSSLNTYTDDVFTVSFVQRFRPVAPVKL